MQASTAPPVANTTTNTTTVTKSREQVLIQSSGAMIAVIVIGIIIIFTILLFILKTYNRRTHVSRVMGARGSKPHPRGPESTSTTNVPLTAMGVSSVSSSITDSHSASGNAFQLPRVELSSAEGNRLEQSSTNSGSTAVTMHEHPSIENT